MADNKSASDDDYSEEEEVKQLSQEEKNSMLLTAVKDNNLEGTQEALELGADYNYEEGGWNPLLWAACNGNEDIVRLLISRGAHQKYMDNEAAVNDEGGDEDEEKDNFKPVPDPAKVGRHTPMHWASYHGHIKVVWLLMGTNMNPLLQDIHGNNCIH